MGSRESIFGRDTSQPTAVWVPQATPQAAMAGSWWEPGWGLSLSSWYLSMVFMKDFLSPWPGLKEAQD